MHGTPSQGIFSIAFRDALHGIIVGGDYAHPEQGGANIAATEDGGNTWRLSSIQPQRFFSAVAYIGHGTDHNTILAVGSQVSALSRDGIHRWEFFGPAGFNAISSANDSVYAVGANGNIGELAPYK